MEEVCAKRGLNEKPSSEEGEWITRDEVCDMLHITFTTLWRMERSGQIKKHKIGRRNLYDKKEVNTLLCESIESGDRKLK